jgi:asparagine synthase (glutamine-hydrolysing)
MGNGNDLAIEVVEGRFEARDELPPGISIVDDRLTIRGRPTNAAFRYIHVDGSTIRMSENLGAMERRLHDLGLPITVDPTGITEILMHGLVAVPDSSIDGVMKLASGDTVAATTSGAGITLSASNDFPWVPDKSRRDGVPDTAVLRKLIAAATSDAVGRNDGDAALLLSSGKDSVSVAVGLAEAGLTSVPCFTFRHREDDVEYEYAADLCHRLGLEHHTVPMPDDAETVRRNLMRYFHHAPAPSVDMTVPAYMILAERAGLGHGALLDGSGSDLYMGWRATRANRIKRRFRIRNRTVSNMVRRALPIHSPLNYLTRSEVGSVLQLRLFRPHEIARFYPDAVDVDDRWYELSDREGLEDRVAWLAASPLRLDEAGRTTNKAFLAAEASGKTVELPFADERIAEYYFNLPEGARYDRGTNTIKVLLRDMLAESVDYDPVAMTKSWFGFDATRLLTEHPDWVRDEVLGCELWSSEVEPLFDRLVDVLPRRPFVYHALYALFMVSGWHNHCEYLTR